MSHAIEPKLVRMVLIYANGPTCALVEARQAFGWYYEGCGGAPIEIVVPDCDKAYELSDAIQGYGLSVSVFAAPPEPEWGQDFPENDLFWAGDRYA